MTLRQIDKLERHIVESGVRREIKLAGTRSSGEAKFHIGSARNREEFDNFFNNFDDSNIYKFNKENLKEFLLSTKFEYMFQVFQKYQGVSLAYWEEKYNEVLKMEEEILFKLERFVDSRYYIFSSERIFKNFIRSITLPYLTRMVISKFHNQLSDVYVYEFNFYLNDQFDRQPINGSEIEGNQLYENEPGKNLILYGPPGTGKSYELDRRYASQNCIRVTFHPEYTYHDFVGSYRPEPLYKEANSYNFFTEENKIFEKGEPYINYRFIPGPFTLILEKSLASLKSNSPQMFTLIIEEINRANTPAVFGDLFQLLDRNSNGESRYGVTNLEILRYLRSKGIIDDSQTEIKLPKNLNLVATMNSADQGVFVLDSAFKRRWIFEYLPIKPEEAEHRDELVAYNGKFVRWEEFIKTLNELLADLGVNEDRHFGPYFLKQGEPSNKDLVASKLLMYLWDDVGRTKRDKIFANEIKTFSQLVKLYKEGFPILKTNFDFVETSTSSNNESQFSADSNSIEQANLFDDQGIDYDEGKD